MGIHWTDGPNPATRQDIEDYARAKKLLVFISSVSILVALAVFWSEVWGFAAAFGNDAVGFARGFGKPEGSPEYEASWATLRFLATVVVAVLGLWLVTALLEADEDLDRTIIVIRFKSDRRQQK